MFHYVEKSILWVLCCNTRFPLWLSHLKSAYNSAGDCLQSRRPRFDLLVRKIPQRRNWRLSPVPFPGKSHRQRASGYSSWAHNKLNMIWQLNYHQQKKKIIMPRKNIKPRQALGAGECRWLYFSPLCFAAFPKYPIRNHQVENKCFNFF